MSEQLSPRSNLKDSIVGRLSPHDSSLEGMFAKLGVILTGFLGGITISELLTFASLVYVCLNIFVLVRDKVINKSSKQDSKSHPTSGD